MKEEDQGRLCVVGAGTLGGQISLHFALSGHSVRVFDVSPNAVESAQRRQFEELSDRVERGVLDDRSRDAAAGRITFVTDLAEAVCDADVVIEAVSEQLPIKRRVFLELDRLAPPDALLATNSSSIRISAIESAVTRPERVLNAHFYNPVWERPVVELMKGSQTSDKTIERMRQLCLAANLTPLIVRKEITGFIFNRVWRAVKKETLKMADDGVASYEDIDRAWMIALGLPIGPFGMMDRVGLDVVRDIEWVYQNESGDSADAPPPLLLDKIERGELGRKSGKGFYTYPDPVYEDPEWLKGKSK